MAMIATLYDDGRSAERHLLDADATVRGPDQVPIDVLVADLSLTGCLFLCTEPLTIDSTITIGVAGIGRRQAWIVRAEEPRFGCVFAAPLSAAELSAALADQGTIAPFRLSSEQSSGIEEANVPLWPWQARLAIIAGLTVASWTAVLVTVARLV